MAMRIAMIGPVPETWGGPPRTGGVSSYVQGLASALAELDVHLSLLGDNTGITSGPVEVELPQAIQFHTMSRLSGRSAINAAIRLGPGRLFKMAMRLARHSDPRVPWGQLIRYIDRAANYDLFISKTHPQLLHVAHAEFRQFISQRIVGVSIPVVASVLSGTVILRRPTSDWLVRITIQNYNRASRLLVCSNFVREVIAPYVDEPDKIIIVPNGVDTERFRPRAMAEARAQLGLNDQEFIILFTGILAIPKGVDLLLQAFANILPQFPKSRLVFVGTGPEAATLDSLAAQMGISGQVTLAGYRPSDELPSWYAACDVFVLPSQSEGLSTSILEAMSSGRPVITTYPDIGEHDAVEDGVNGLLCRYGDVEALTASLLTMARSSDMARRMGDAARKKVEARFKWSVIARQVRDVYGAVLQEDIE